MKVVGYVYSNNPNKAKQTEDIELQIKRIKKFCSLKGETLSKIYEEAESSRDDYKPALIQLITDAKLRTFDKLVISDLKVFGNDTAFTFWVITELKRFHLIVTPILDALEEDKEQELKPNNNIELKIKNKVKDIGSLPEVVTKVTELVQNPKSSAAQLSKVIAHDPGLTSKVLRLVNSAYYGFPKQISSIQHAIMILGFTTMRGLVLSSSIYKIFTPKNTSIIALDYKKLWKHLLITAVVAKKINKMLFFEEGEDIFSSAILHDIGKIILDQYDHDNYIKVLHQLRKSGNIESELTLEEKFCGANHQKVGYIVAEEWNLPENLAEVINYHHNPMEAQKNKQLVSVVYVSNIISHMATDGLNMDMDEFIPEVLDYLGLSEDSLLFILEEIKAEMDEYKSLESFFN